MYKTWSSWVQCTKARTGERRTRRGVRNRGTDVLVYGGRIGPRLGLKVLRDPMVTR